MIKHNGKIYLSGGMERAVDLGSGWRIKCSEELNHMNFMPLDITALDKHYTAIHGKVITGDNELQDKSNIRHQFIYTDLRLIIEDADAVIAYYDEAFKNGAGSFAECQCAYDHDKPLFIVSAFPKEQMPSWLKALSTKIFFDFEDLYDYLAKLPKQILVVDRYGNHSSGNQYLCSLCGDTFEKSKHHYVSKVSPAYCKRCVDIVLTTREKHADRYEYISDYLEL